MATAKRRVRSKHSGVKLKKRTLPSGAISWRAIYRDPDTNKDVYVTLDERVLGSADARKRWATDKSKVIAKRAMELESGAVRATGTLLSDAVDRYFAAHPQLSERSKQDYRIAADHLLEWAKGLGVVKADDLTRPRLMAFRESRISAPKRLTVKGKGVGRGKREAGSKLRSSETVNGELRKVRTILGYLRRLDLLPHLSNDDLRDALTRLTVTRERIDYLKPPQCQALLEAALRHDEQVFVETRDEHAREGRRRIGTTPRFEPIAPLIAHLLLTGCRFGEALSLDWSSVHLDAADYDGHKVGEIHLQGADVKTRQARTIDLAVSPALRTMLETLKGNLRAEGRVFGVTEPTAETALRRLRSTFGAPKNFTFQGLRRTCGTYLTNAPAIFGAASAYRSAKQLGHGVAVAERHYLGLERISRDARTLEAAMQIEEQMERVIASVSAVGR